LTSQPIPFVLSLLRGECSFQELFFNLRALLVRFGKDSVDFFLLLQRSVSGSIVLPVSPLLKLLEQVLLLFRSLWIGLDLHSDDLFTQLGSSSSRLSVLS
jgi:hypothetical protein